MNSTDVNSTDGWWTDRRWTADNQTDSNGIAPIDSRSTGRSHWNSIAAVGNSGNEEEPFLGGVAATWAETN